MISILKNKYLTTGVFVILASIGFSNIVAKPAWSREPDGRVFIYSSNPMSSGEQAALASIVGAGMLGFALLFDHPLLVKVLIGGGGAVCAGAGIFEYLTSKDEPPRPLIIIDSYGIEYGSRNKILWKNVYGYECVRNDDRCTCNRYVLNNNNQVCYCGYNHRSHADYLEISTATEKIKIYEDNIAVTLKMLYSVIDEAYSAHKNVKNR